MPGFDTAYLTLTTPCRWLRGNHHGHSTVSDGANSPLDTMRAYEAAGYDYFALSEHDALLPVAELQPYPSMCIVPAVEVTSMHNQTLLYLGADRVPPKGLSAREIMEHVHAAGGLFIFDHPNWRPFPDYATDDLLFSMVGMRGMEIYTGVIERLAGEARATDRWDCLLSRSWRVFGHGTDDQHKPVDYFVAWNQVQWPEGEKITPGSVVAALASGRFYASTGVTLTQVGVTPDGQHISVDSDADEIHWVICDGVVAKKVKGGSGTFSMVELGDNPAEAIYVRAECLGHGNAMAWTQPFWITP